ncbi:alcohol dehydrogenase catalytic domain-containing protein [Thaumasiovibrio sp. DFM-14]|uniref:alcohol dehydrogenase catalytic domain-containing protein n=1 Tax=Thaumasiovibrio sp. DFM-14 TaxID=3384792 RepID=UPI00399F70D2
MLSIAVKSNNKLEVVQTSKPALKESSVIVKVHVSGLCGSDLPRIFASGAHFYPIVLGHEFAGEVVEVGENVTSLNVGDRIACAPLVPCGECPQCERGRYSLCKDYDFIGSRVQGGNAEFVEVPEKCCFVLDDTVSSLQGAFFEPLTVSLHPILMAGGVEGKDVVIIGVGTIGLLAVQAVKAMGAATVTAIDISKEKLLKAKQLGADYCFNSLDEDIAEQMALVRFAGEQQFILETAGSVASVKQCLNVASPRANIALIGTLHNDFTLTHQEFGQILRKELHLFGSWMNYSAPYPGKEWQLARDLFSKDLIDIEALVDGMYEPDEFIKRVESLKGNSPDGKILLKWS